LRNVIFLLSLREPEVSPAHDSILTTHNMITPRSNDCNSIDHQ